MVFVLLNACTFEFSEDYFNDIEYTPPEGGIVLLDFQSGDELSASRTILYTIPGITNTYFEMRVLVDDQEIYNSTNPTAEFYLHIEELEDGAHDLTVEYVISSDSGSLADRSDAEYLGATETFSFIVDKSLASAFGISSVEIREGTVFVALNEISDDNFEEAYLIVKDENGYISNEILLSDLELENLEVNDTQTVHYHPSYAIKVKNAFTEQLSDFVALETPLMEISMEIIDFRRFKLKSTEHPLYANFDSFSFDYYYERSFRHSLDPRGEEIIIPYGYAFGKENYLWLKYIKDGQEHGGFGQSVTLGTVMEIQDFEEIIYSKSLNKYFVLDLTLDNTVNMYQLNGDSMLIEKTNTLFSIDFPNDFNAMELNPITENLVLNFKGKSVIFDTNTFAIASVFNSVDYNSAKPSAITYYREDYIVLEDAWSSGQVIFYDRLTKEEVYSINKTSKFYASYNLEYFVANGDLHKRNSSGFEFVTTLSHPLGYTSDIEYLIFDNENSRMVFGWYRNNIFYNLLSNYTVDIWEPDIVKDLHFTENQAPFFTSNHFSAGNRVELYDQNYDSSKRLQVYGTHDQKYRYYNGHIFSTKGLYIETNLFRP